MEALKVAISLVWAFAFRLFKRRPLWLISDRYDRAGDNGEALFRYLRAEHPEIDARFTVATHAPEYRELRRLGHVVPWRSLRRKVLTLLADCLISSQAERAFTNPFWGYDRLVRNRLAGKPFVFLQHGVTKDDISAFVRSRAHPISAIVCASARERDAFLAPAYGLCSDQVWLTGFPRWDRLQNAAKRYIMVMPTWRLDLEENPDAVRRLETFYRAFLSDDGLLQACRSTGYQIIVAPHCNLRRFFHVYADDDDVVRTVPEEVSYRSLISEGALLVTDYSSIAFDFAYLNKPVIYFQFDQTEFWNGAHTYRHGYFDYERDGFGPVVTTVEDLVDKIKERITMRISQADVFCAREKAFFAYPSDNNNSKRVFAHIVRLMREI